MIASFRLGLSVAAAVVLGLTAVAQAKAVVVAAPQKPAAQAANADAVVIGKVTEVEAETVEATADPGAPKDQKASYKVAVLKIDEALMGGSGLTRFRVGFPADAPPAMEPVAPGKPGGPGVGGRIRRPPMVVALTPGMEGCFCLKKHHEGDFYIQAGPPLLKKAENYSAELDQVKKVVKAIDDPVTALKAKELDDRFRAALVVLQRYQTVRGPVKPGTTPAREPIPDEENKLIVALITELPWLPKDGSMGPPGIDQKPSRSALWYMINAPEYGFKHPEFGSEKPGDPPVDIAKVMEETTTQFLKENGNKIKIKRFVTK
jgi:hypothetical protein